jgi:hypothetical protein
MPAVAFLVPTVATYTRDREFERVTKKESVEACAEKGWK